MTDVEKLRLLIGDGASPQNFTDDQLQAFLDIGGSLYMAAALASDSLVMKANKSATKSIRLGDYSESFSSTELQAASQKWRDLEYNTPAFAEVEQNLSVFSGLEIIRNYVLRTEV